MDVSVININGQDYQLTIDPEACHYGPTPLTFTLLEIIGGIPSPLTNDVTVNVQWQENWTIETIIIPIEVPVTDPNCDLCNDGYQIVIDPITSPTQPDFTCNEIDLIFHVPTPLNCDDGICSNGEEVWNADLCMCESINIPDPTCIDDGNCENLSLIHI